MSDTKECTKCKVLKSLNEFNNDIRYKDGKTNSCKSCTNTHRRKKGDIRRKNRIEANPKMVQHHVKYLELHGVDEVIMLTDSEHKLLHARLRRQGKCKVPVNDLKKIVLAAHRRTDMCKEYHQNNIGKIYFTETVGKNIRLCEQLSYNNNTGSVYYSAAFGGYNGYTLPVIGVD